MLCFFGGENRTLFWTQFPLLPLLSGAARSECGVRKLLGEGTSPGLLPGPRPAVVVHSGCRQACLWTGHLLGHKGPGGGDQVLSW